MDKDLKAQLDRASEMKAQQEQQERELFRDKLDYLKLAEIKNKPLLELTDNDLAFIGISPVNRVGYEDIYFCQDLSNIKIYLKKCSDKYELLGFRLVRLKDIYTTDELLNETLTKWKLKLNDD